MTAQNDHNKKRALIYVRVSTTEQADEGNSLKTQEKLCREYAAKLGYEVVDVYVEAGESAKTANRTQLQKMIGYCVQKKNRVNAIIIYKIDRLSRDTDDYSQLRMLFKRYGIEIKSATEPFENTPAGRFMENIIANVAQFDNDVRAERCSNGMREAMREGRYVWGAPVGYSNGAKLNGKPTIEPNDMAPLVAESFKLMATGLYKTQDLWRLMTKKGLHLKSGKSVSNQYFHEMLRNKLYTGWVEKFGERHKGKFEAIVDEATFEQVQRVLKNKGHKVGNYKTDNPEFPLRRFVFNPNGKKITGSFAKGKYPSYRFLGVSGNYERDEFERHFVFLMDSYAFGEEHVDKLKRLVKEQFEKATADSRTEAETLRKRLEELDTEQTALLQKNIKGVVNDAVLAKQLERIAKETAEIHAGLALASDTGVSPQEAVGFAESYLLKPSSVWRNAPISVQTKLQWFQFPSGVVFDGKIFGTTKVASVFKAKDLIVSPLSTRVDPSGFEPLTSTLQM